MHIRHVHIRRFRGIVSLDWDVKAQLVCLVGPGDSTKTTILDAISYALSPRWSLPIHDGDFHNGDTSHPKDWFKRQDRGEALGQLVARALAEAAGSDLAAKLHQLERFAHADPDPDPPAEPSLSPNDAA
jgi:predicted ATP-binding protein involved in virulence